MKTEIQYNEGGGFRIFFTSPTGKEHSVVIPQSVEGLEALESILRKRAMQPVNTIAMESAPTQRQTEEIVKAFGGGVTLVPSTASQLKPRKPAWSPEERELLNMDFSIIDELELADD